MQKIIKNTELIEYIDKSISILADAVKTTIGPNGNNVIINTSNMPPFITNDGVTIASSIADEDEITNTILTIIKEAAIKTDTDVGDGTTTTIVLLESIYKNSIKEIDSLNDAIKLKEELETSAKEITDNLAKFSHSPNEKELEHIASISANDEKIGKLITEFYLQLDKSDNIKILENTTNSKDYVQKKSGYFIDNYLASPYLFKEKESSIKNPTIILFNNDITDIAELESLIYANNKLNQDIVIIANSFAENVINDVLALNYETNQKIILINNPEYGIRRLAIIEDLINISRSKKDANYYQGTIKEFKVNEDKLEFIYDSNNSLISHIEKLKKELLKTQDEYEKAFLKDRISKLSITYGYIYVGGQTKLERREKKMRFTDALCALYATKEGILPGSALPYYQISEELDQSNLANHILNNALKAPLIQILKNSNIDYQEIIKKIKDNNYQIIFNAKNKTFEHINKTNVLDNLRVLKCAFNNALSIATLLLTTSHLVINTNTNSQLNLDEFHDNI